MSRNVQGGIRLLEESLFRQNNGNTDIKAKWIQLQRLYTDLMESDILLGISKKVLSTETAKLTSRALDDEMAGKYPEAIKIYNQLIESDCANNSNFVEGKVVIS